MFLLPEAWLFAVSGHRIVIPLKRLKKKKSSKKEGSRNP